MPVKADRTSSGSEVKRWQVILIVGIFVLAAASLGLFLLTGSGHQVIPVFRRSDGVQFTTAYKLYDVSDEYYIMKDDNDRYGVLSRKGKTVVPFTYYAMEFLDKNEQGNLSVLLKNPPCL